MVRLGAPSQLDKYFYTDNSDDILKIHQLGFHPEWKDYDGTVYFKISKKLLKALAKHGIEF